MVSLHKIPSYLGWLVILIGVFWAITYAVDIMHDYRHANDGAALTQRLDSIGTDMALLKQQKAALESRVSDLESSISKRDSFISNNQKQVENEIKKLHVVDNRIILSINDSILRARGAR